VHFATLRRQLEYQRKVKTLVRNVFSVVMNHFTVHGVHCLHSFLAIYMYISYVKPQQVKVLLLKFFLLNTCFTCLLVSY